MTNLPPNYDDQIDDLADTLSELNLSYLTQINNSLRHCPNRAALDKIQAAMRVMHKHLELRLLRIDEENNTSESESESEDEPVPLLNQYALDVFRDWAFNKGVPFSFANYFIHKLNRLDYTARIMKGQFTRIYNNAIRNGRTFPPQN